MNAGHVEIPLLTINGTVGTSGMASISLVLKQDIFAACSHTLVAMSSKAFEKAYPFAFHWVNV